MRDELYVVFGLSGFFVCGVCVFCRLLRLVATKTSISRSRQPNRSLIYELRDKSFQFLPIFPA